MEGNIEDILKQNDLLMKQNSMLVGEIKGLKDKFTKENPDDIRFISLVPHTVVLSTQGYGKGTIYTFKEFNEEIPVPFEDAKLIIKNNKNFCTNGTVYVDNADFRKAMYIDKFYENIRTCEELEKLFAIKDKFKFEKEFKKLNEKQRKTIEKLQINKMLKSNKYDVGIVEVINMVMDKNLLEVVEFLKGK